MSKIGDTFSAGIAKRIETETLAREGKKLTRNELIDTFRESARDAQQGRNGWTSDRFADWLSDAPRYDDPKLAGEIGSAVSRLPESVRSELLGKLDELLKDKKLTPEARSFTMQIMKGSVGPEYKGWGPTN
jgi:hypothetical protein